MSWANITWIFLHSYAEKININFLNNNKNNCLGLVKYLCTHLPCPICSKHAYTYFSKNDINNVTNKEELKKYLWSFHNDVNIRLKKPPFKYEDLEKYKYAIFPKIAKKFIIEYEKPYMYTKTMNSWVRKKFTKKVRLFIYYNRSQFA